jgi:hypothetical protein
MKITFDSGASGADSAAVVPTSTILIVDEPFHRKSLEMMMKPEGYANRC